MLDVLHNREKKWLFSNTEELRAAIKRSEVPIWEIDFYIEQLIEQLELERKELQSNQDALLEEKLKRGADIEQALQNPPEIIRPAFHEMIDTMCKEVPGLQRWIEKGLITSVRNGFRKTFMCNNGINHIFIKFTDEIDDNTLQKSRKPVAARKQNSATTGRYNIENREAKIYSADDLPPSITDVWRWLVNWDNSKGEALAVIAHEIIHHSHYPHYPQAVEVISGLGTKVWIKSGGKELWGIIKRTLTGISEEEENEKTTLESALRELHAYLTEFIRFRAPNGNRLVMAEIIEMVKSEYRIGDEYTEALIHGALGILTAYGLGAKDDEVSASMRATGWNGPKKRWETLDKLNNTLSERTRIPLTQQYDFINVYLHQLVNEELKMRNIATKKLLELPGKLRIEQQRSDIRSNIQERTY